MIYLLPGMGADQRMYAGPWRELPQTVGLDWPVSSPSETIADLAREIVATAKIPDGATVVGSSLGGIVACEIAKLRRLEALFLIGSARHPSEINPLLRLLHPLIDLAPLPFIQQASGKIPHELLTMFQASDATFIRRMCRAIFAWEGLGATMMPVHRLHGQFDLVIPSPADADQLLPGGHLIAISHSAECVAFVRAHLGL